MSVSDVQKQNGRPQEEQLKTEIAVNLSGVRCKRVCSHY